MSRITSMEGLIESALKFLQGADIPKSVFPEDFEGTHGIVILESAEVGFLFKAEVGTGLLMRHDKETKSWSAPLAVGITGVGAGFTIGAEKRNMIIFLSGEQITKAMASDFSLSIGFDQSFSVGPAGEGNVFEAQVGNKGKGVSAAYSQNKGIFTGVSAETTAMAPRTHINTKFYGEKLRPKEIVFAKVEDVAPESESLLNLHETLNKMIEFHKEWKMKGDLEMKGRSVDFSDCK